MNVLAFYASNDREVVEEIRAWSAQVLEKESPYFNGLPPCPYAKKAWQDNRVAIIFKYGGNRGLFDVLTKFNDALDLVIIVDRNPQQTSEEFHDYNDALNDAISRGIFGDRDLWVMGFHPDDEANDFVQDVSFEAKTDDTYAMIFVQRLTKLHLAADKLNKKGYYAAYDGLYDSDGIYARREQLYRRLTDGDEAP
jgi:hypothetical protein